jgi:DNA polymerase III subunit alpha
MNYIPLNVKSSYFLLSSLNDIKQLINKCRKYNIESIGITDPNMFGVMEFYKECKNNDIKPIIGLEIEFENNKFYLYAMNYEGYQNLTRLLYVKQEQGLNINVLKEYRANLLCILPYELSASFNTFKDLYLNLYLSYKNKDEREELINLSNKLIYMNEVLYLSNTDSVYLKYLYLIRDGKKIDELFSYNIESNSHLLTGDEVLEVSYEKDLEYFEEISNLCNVEFSFNEKLLPKYNNNKDFNDYEYLKALCRKGLEKRLDIINPLYIDRLKYELSVINKMGFNNYFLVVWDFVRFAKKNNILTGPGRGSAAGSLVSYCLGITDVDPIKYNLLFERFLNPERISMPDIDIDFESNRRGEVVEYVIDKYGPKRAMPIITFVTLGGRQVIRDIGRIFSMETKDLDLLCKVINPYASLVNNLKDNQKLKELLSQNQKLKDIYKIGIRLEGMKRQISVHAAGIVISDLGLDSYIPLQKYDNHYVTGYSMEHLEELGLLKIDLLGLKNLTLIEGVLKLINEKDNLQFNNIPLDDKETLLLFEKAFTDGIFQFESTGMKNFIRKLKPNNFEEIVAAIALFRPGPMANIDSYIKRKFGYEKIEYIHPDLINILKPTYGIIIYQEQIMQIANVMANYSLGEADVLRRAMSKKKREVLESEQEKFVKRCLEKGYSIEIAKKVYNLILKFADYGFNRAHSVAYSLIGYKMAYLKVHYPKYFMSNLLTNTLGNEIKTKEYISECKINNIAVLKPDVNLSEYNYKVEEAGIRFSLAALRNVGGITCKEIIKERMKGEFTDFFDFIGRTYGRAVSRKTIESLIDVGAFNLFGYNHKTLHHNLENAISYADIVRQTNMSLIEKPLMEAVDEFNKEELAKREIEVLGFYLTNHPVSKFQKVNDNIMLTTQVESNFDKMVRVIICVDKIKEVETKKNEQMIFILGSDELSTIDIVVFPNVYPKFKEVKKGDVLLVTGRVEKRMSRYQLVAREIEILSKI